MNKRNLLNYRNAIIVLLLAGLSGCSYWRQPAAPVESGSPTALSSGGAATSGSYNSAPAETAPVETGTTVKPVEPQQHSSAAGSTVASNATTHVVQPGENLFRISLNHGLKYQDVAQWNNLPDHNIKVGQVLRLTPPGSSTTATKTTPAQTAETSKTTTGTTGSGTAAATATASSAETGKGSQSGDSPPRENGIVWMWPTEGSVIQGYSANNKGLDIAGKAGQPIYAAAAGTVAYSGSGLRGYGKLIIIKHDKTFLSAYAHNSVLLVTEGKTVKKGQKIAEMGNTDADRVKLHFEIRRFGKPVDPAQYLK